MSRHFGRVDHRKVKYVLLRYRVQLAFVIVFSFATNFLVLYVILQNLFIVGLVLGNYIAGVIFVLLLNDIELSRNAHTHSDEFSQPKTAEHEFYTVLWEESCANAGFCSGGVYVVSPRDPTRCPSYFETFAVSRQYPFSKERKLFIHKTMLGRFTPMQMRAIVLHESGHMLWVPFVVRYLVAIATLPINMILSSVALVRRKCTQVYVARLLHWFERELYWVSRFCVVQSEEYAADAHVAKMQGTATHIIDVLLFLELELLFLHPVNWKRGVLGPKWKEDAHLHTHPLTLDRIARLQALHEDSRY